MAGLAQTPEVFKEILDQLVEGCQLLGPDWTYVYVNQAVADHFRVPIDHLVGRKMTEVYPGIERTPLFATLSRCMTSRVHGRFTQEFAFADGSTRWFDMSIQPVPAGPF